jgi:hypothetical protein
MGARLRALNDLFTTEAQGHRGVWRLNFVVVKITSPLVEDQRGGVSKEYNSQTTVATASRL